MISSQALIADLLSLSLYHMLTKFPVVINGYTEISSVTTCMWYSIFEILLSMCIELHFSMLNGSIHFTDQSVKLFKSLWIVLVLFQTSTIPYSLESSANTSQIFNLTSLGMSFIKMTKRVCPETEPCRFLLLISIQRFPL